MDDSEKTDLFQIIMAAKKKLEEQRTILVIMSNRLDRNQKPKYLELVCQADGSILKQTKLRSAPKSPDYDEVWENDEGRTEFDSCTRMKRKYGHALQKK